VKVAAGARAAGVAEVRSCCRETHVCCRGTQALCRGREHREAVVPLASLPNIGGNKKYLGMCRKSEITKILVQNIPPLVYGLPHPLELPLFSRAVQQRVSLLCTRGRCLMVDSYNHSLLFP